LLGEAVPAPNYIRLPHNGATPDEMYTSFGPRINRDKKELHDGAGGVNIAAFQERFGRSAKGSLSSSGEHAGDEQ
jgi:hypothetical protein